MARPAGGGTDTLMFVVNFADGNGFAFISNDDRDGEILLYAENGNFEMQDTAGNPGLKMHVEMMPACREHKLDEIRTAEANGEKRHSGHSVRQGYVHANMEWDTKDLYWANKGAYEFGPVNAIFHCRDII